MGFLGLLYDMGKEIHHKRGMDKTVQAFKKIKEANTIGSNL